MEQMTGSLRKICIVFMILILALICRLAYIQLAGGEELSEATRMQSLISLEGINTRGIIYDRNGAALVADKKRFIYIIKESNFDIQTGKLLKEMGAKQVSSDNKGYYVYSSEDYDKNKGKKLIREHQAYILQASARYSDDQTAVHLIGYVNKKDSSGAAGLELMYDDQLSVLNRHIYAVADVNGNILPGRGLLITSDEKKDSYVKEGIRTTVDKNLQQAVEGIIGREKDDCAVVVLDSKTGGIAAMACTPKFNPNNIDKYINGETDELLNKAAQGQYAPGSIFKIVVAAAALEENVDVNKSFVCNSSASVGNLKIGCETGGEAGHGAITFREAFADSCNSFFVQLGQEIGAEEILDMAEKFHLGEKALKKYPQQAKGHLMTEKESYGAAIGNLSIGQGELLVTPMQVARMTNIIASGGVDRGLHILMDDALKKNTEEQVISKATADTVGEMMADVTKMGTGKSLQLTTEDGSPKTAIKTGTAEYGEKDERKTHGWITGYAPCDDPEYVVTVFVEGGESGSGTAGPVYKKILRYLEMSGSYTHPTLA